MSIKKDERVFPCWVDVDVYDILADMSAKSGVGIPFIVNRILRQSFADAGYLKFITPSSDCQVETALD